jgi:hypothetical protein
MKDIEIAARFARSLERFGNLRVRVLKLRALCERSGVAVEDVLAHLPLDVQERIRQS